MGKLVPLNKIFSFTKKDKKSIEEAFELKDSFDENVFPYSEIPELYDSSVKMLTEYFSSKVVR